MTTSSPTATPTATAHHEHKWWCNIRHQPGANPNRQSHLHTWKRRYRGNPLKVELYPVRGNQWSRPGLLLRIYGMHNGYVSGYLDARDMRALALTMLDLADAAERGSI